MFVYDDFQREAGTPRAGLPQSPLAHLDLARQTDDFTLFDGQLVDVVTEE